YLRVILALSIHTAQPRRAETDLQRAHRATAVVEHEPAGCPPDPVARDPERLRHVGGELRVLEEVLEDLAPRDERLALHARGEGGLIDDGREAGADGGGNVGGQRRCQASG